MSPHQPKKRGLWGRPKHNNSNNNNGVGYHRTHRYKPPRLSPKRGGTSSLHTSQCRNYTRYPKRQHLLNSIHLHQQPQQKYFQEGNNNNNNDDNIFDEDFVAQDQQQQQPSINNDGIRHRIYISAQHVYESVYRSLLSPTSTTTTNNDNEQSQQQTTSHHNNKRYIGNNLHAPHFDDVDDNILDLQSPQNSNPASHLEKKYNLFHPRAFGRYATTHPADHQRRTGPRVSSILSHTILQYQQQRQFFTWGTKKDGNNNNNNPDDPIIILPDGSNNSPHNPKRPFSTAAVPGMGNHEELHGIPAGKTAANQLMPYMKKTAKEDPEQVNVKSSLFWSTVYKWMHHAGELPSSQRGDDDNASHIAHGQKLIAEQQMKEMTRVLAEKIRERDILIEAERRKKLNLLRGLWGRVTEPIRDFKEGRSKTDPWGLQSPDGSPGTRHYYSNLEPFLFSSPEYESVMKQDFKKLLEVTKLKPVADMVVEFKDDLIDYLNKKEPWGQRKKDRKYRLLNRLNKPYARYSLEELEDPDHPDNQAINIRQFNEEMLNYHAARIRNERRAIELKRKARVAMGLEPDLELERRWYELTGDRAYIQLHGDAGNQKVPGGGPTSTNKGQTANDFELFRQQYLDNFGQRKYRRKIAVKLDKDGKPKKIKQKDLSAAEAEKKKEKVVSAITGEEHIPPSDQFATDHETDDPESWVRGKRWETHDNLDDYFRGKANKLPPEEQEKLRKKKEAAENDGEGDETVNEEELSLELDDKDPDAHLFDHLDPNLKRVRMAQGGDRSKPFKTEALNDIDDPQIEQYRWPLQEDILKARRNIYDPYDGLPMWRDDLLGLTRDHAARMPADEEDLDWEEQQHWRRQLKKNLKKKYFKGGWKFDYWEGRGAMVVAPLAPARARGRVKRRMWKPVTYGFGGTRGPRSPHLIYDYIYGRKINNVRGQGGVVSVGLFQKFPKVFMTRQPDIPWTGTTALTYDPAQNHMTKWELRRKTIKYKISMSPLGDMGRSLWKLWNIDMFPFTHLRAPFNYIMFHFKWLRGLRHALARWVKTATHPYIDEKFAYQANRFGERPSTDVYHFVNEYDYLKEYQLPTVVRAIREYDFPVLQSACSKHALFCILKWMNLQERFGIFHESRLNYWVESLNIREVRKNEHGKIVLDVEFILIEPPYFYNRAGGKIFADNRQYKMMYRPEPLLMNMTLLRDHNHPDFDYEVIDFSVDARRIKRTFNNIERIYHAAQRSRTQYYKAPKFYAVPRTAVKSVHYSRRTRVVNAYKAQLENGVFQEKDLEFTNDMEAKYTDVTKYRNTMALSKYIIALQMEPIIDYFVATVQSQPGFKLHPIERDRAQYWENRKELDLVKFRQREARRVRAQQNTLHRYFHRLRAVAHFKHSFDHGGDINEFRRLHIDKLAIDANHDDWVQKWLVDPERAGRPYFKGKDRFAKKLKLLRIRKKRRKFHKSKKRKWFRQDRLLSRFTKREQRTGSRLRRTPRHGRKRRKRFLRRKRKLGHNTNRRRFKKRRRFLPFMERVYHRMPRGVFNEYRKFFRARNRRVNAFKGNTTFWSHQHKGPGYSIYDTSWHEKWHVWDGGYYNPNEDCYTRADVFNPANDPFEPRRNYLLSFMDDNTIRIPYMSYRNWDLPWRLVYQSPTSKKVKGRRWKNFGVSKLQKAPAKHLRSIPRKRDLLRFQNMANAELYDLNDDAEFEHLDDLNKWPKPEDEKWDV